MCIRDRHFLVSALNEMIAIKNDLKVLQDRGGKRLKEYQFEVVNDELIVTDEDGELFEYNPTNKESQRIQESLFHEKQTIIENCLFGVDINPNSVKICRLRLWIELLKNAYYKNESELETLPNIDINIKCGNSLISRFELDADLKKALKSSKWTIDSYRIAVDTYRNAQNKEQKREMEKLIDDIKNDFRSEISLNDPKVKKLNKLKGEIFGMTNQTQMFELTKREKTAWNKKLKKLTEDSKKLETIIEEIKNNKIYEEAFEWRFEFPEVLDDNGDFVGFDAIIGNPPYIDSRENIINEKAYWKIKYDSAKYGKTNTYEVFVELGINLLNKNGYISYIIPVVWLSLDACKGSRQAIFKQNQIIKFAFTEDSVFEDANVDTLVFVIKKNNPLGNYEIIKFNNEFDQILNLSNHSQNKLDELYSINLESNEILEKVVSKNKNIGSLDNIVTIYNGIATGPGKEKYFSETKVDESYKPLLMGNDVHKYYYDKSTIWIHYDRKRLHRARNEEIFLNKEKIIMQRIRNLKLDERIIATIDYEKHYTFNSVNNLLLDDEMYNLKYVLGILNSKMFNYLYKSISKNTNITAQDLNKVPFRLIDFKDNSDLDFYNRIIEKVTALLNETEAELKLDTKLLELDNLVYDLYGITEDEIKIIEEANA